MTLSLVRPLPDAIVDSMSDIVGVEALLCDRSNRRWSVAFPPKLAVLRENSPLDHESASVMVINYQTRFDRGSAMPKSETPQVKHNAPTKVDPLVGASVFLSKSLSDQFMAIKDPIKRSRELTRFYLSSIARYELTDQTAPEIEITDGPEDGGLDGYIVSTASKELTLIQCKWFDTPRALSLAESQDLLNFWRLHLGKGDLNKLSSPVKSFVIRARGHFQTYEVSLIYLTNAELDPTALAEYRAQKAAFHHVGLSELGTRYAKVLSEVEEIHNEAVISVVGDQYLKFDAVFPATHDAPREDVPVLQCAIRGIDLKRLYKTFQEDLFARNLRLELGGKISEEMESSVTTDQRTAFYVLHNGVSITSEDVRVLSFMSAGGAPDTQTDFQAVPEGDRPYVKEAFDSGIRLFLLLRNFQVVNGAQTTFTFSELPDKPLDGVVLPCKVSRSLDPRVISQIAICNNTQNAITSWDLAANTSELTLLQNYAALKTPPIFVQRRRGETYSQVRFLLSVKPPADRCLVAKNVYQATLSFHGQPGPAYSRTASTVSPGTKAYTEIAGSSNLDEILLAGLIAKFEDKTPVGSKDPEFMSYWTQWAIALLGHIYSRHLDPNEQERWRGVLLGSAGPRNWKRLRQYLSAFVTEFMSHFPADADPQRILRNLQVEWDALVVAGLNPVSIWPLIDPAAKERSFAGMREKQGSRVSTQFYDVNFAIMASYFDTYSKTHPLPPVK
jgi:hypothetical protein